MVKNLTICFVLLSRDYCIIWCCMIAHFSVWVGYQYEGNQTIKVARLYSNFLFPVGVGYQYEGCETIIWETQSATMSGYDITSSEIGGWNLHIHHTYNYQEGKGPSDRCIRNCTPFSICSPNKDKCGSHLADNGHVHFLLRKPYWIYATSFKWGSGHGHYPQSLTDGDCY